VPYDIEAQNWQCHLSFCLVFISVGLTHPGDISKTIPIPSISHHPLGDDYLKEKIMLSELMCIM